MTHPEENCVDSDCALHPTTQSLRDAVLEFIDAYDRGLTLRLFVERLREAVAADGESHDGGDDAR